MNDAQDLGDSLEACLTAAKAHHEKGDYLEAQAAYTTILTREPRHFAAAHLLGLLHHQQGNFAAAKEVQDRALMLNPRSAAAHLNLGRTCRDLGQDEAALRHFQFAVRFEPRNPFARFELACALQRRGQSLEALGEWDQLLALTPQDANAWMNRGLVMMDLQRDQEALSDFDRALALKPDWPELLLNRGVAQIQVRRPEAALEDFNQALTLKPDWAELHMNQAGALHQLGLHHEALQAYDRALALDPGLVMANSCKIGLLDLLPEYGFQELQTERAAFFQHHAQHIKPLSLEVRDRNPDRRLVIGYVSADFKHHATASCFLPILQRHAKSDFQINAYSGVQVEDDWTLRCRACTDLWRPTAHLSDEDLAIQIREDGVDILVDLSGHTQGNRLLVFARKPAPILVTAWGHGGGTGFPMIDYQFADPVAIPFEARNTYAETIFDLPCHIPFEAPPCSPPIGPLPASVKGHVTFGCLNAYRKVDAVVEALWAEVLKSTPGSRLLLKDALFDLPEKRLQITRRFMELGIDAGRIEFRGSTSREIHLATYAEVDLSLDPFPLNGGVSTWESLWMGTPVLAKLGNTLGSRSSAAILSALGLESWIAATDADYVALAQKTAQHLDALTNFRSQCRAQILESPAGNPDRYTRAVEAAYRQMWRRWIQA